MEKIVVGASYLNGVARVADLADVHEARRIENREFDVAFVELAGPFAPVRHTKILITKVVGGDRAVPAMMRHQRKIEHCGAARAIAGGHVFHDLLIGLAHMAVGIDDSGFASSVIAVGFPVRVCFHEITSTFSFCAYSHSRNRIVNVLNDWNIWNGSNKSCYVSSRGWTFSSRYVTQ